MPLGAKTSKATRMSWVNVLSVPKCLVFGFKWHEMVLRGADTNFSTWCGFSCCRNMAELECYCGLCYWRSQFSGRRNGVVFGAIMGALSHG